MLRSRDGRGAKPQARRSAWRFAFTALLFLLVASCSGGGCSGCAGCGMKPLAGGFPKASSITNAAAVRLTRPGLDFLGDNIGTLAGKLITTNGGVIQFPIPSSTSSQSIIGINIDISLCPSGPDANGIPKKCIAEIDIAHAKLHLDAVTQFDPGGGAAIVTEPGIVVSGTIPVRVQDLPIHISLGNIFGDVGIGTGSCVNGKPSNNGQLGFDYKSFPISIYLPLIKETIAPRDGYAKIDAKHAIINPDITANDVAICVDCSGLPIIGQPICDGIFGFIKNLAFSALIGGVKGQLTGAIESATCTQSNAAVTPSCPAGSHVEVKDAGAPSTDAGDAAASDAGTGAPQGTCVYNSDPTTCVPLELGLEGALDLSGLLKSISPGTTGGLDILLAAGGDMNPAPGTAVGADGHTPNGITLGMLGGALPDPQSTCVPFVQTPVPQGIPIPDEMLKDTQTPWPTGDKGPHLGISIAGRFLNFALAGAYNSGLLCLGVSTENFQQLNSGLLSVLIPSIKKLTFESKGAAAAIATRPQSPPVIVLGSGKDIKKDPLLKITLPKFAIDFYIWSYDRFIRAFTFESDITVPLNLQTAKDPKKNPNGGLLPVLGDLAIQNGAITNNDLITDDPATMATALESILGGIAGQLLGGISAIDLSGALASTGLTLTIPDGGIRKLSKGTDDYLGIFADLGVAPTASPMPLTIDTQARLVGKTVHAEAMSFVTADHAKLPELHVAFSSPSDDGTLPVEYAWQLDDSTWSAWSPDRDVIVRNDYLFLQGKHVLSVAARIKGHQATEDESPARVPFTIDTLPPFVRITQAEHDEPFAIDAWDIVSDTSTLTARVRTTDARGELGNWGEWRPLAEVANIDSTATAVDVEVKDEEGNVGSISQALIRGRPDPTLGAAGSGCGGCTVQSHSDLGLTSTLAVLAGIVAFALRRRASFARSIKGAARGRGVAAALGLGSICIVASTSQGCACGSNGGDDTKTNCGPDCNTVCQSALPVGLIGAYTSVTKAKDGSIWVSGYNDAVFSQSTGETYLYGDLVVGRYDTGKQLVQWTSVDGLPPARTDGTCADSDPKGWRRGESDTGDDVGLWTSIQLDPSDHPIVSHYDATHGALRFSAFDGTNWASHTVSGALGSDIGRYSKMLVVDGKPVIAFLVMEKGNNGNLRSKVSLAHAKVAVPQAPADWALEDAIVDENGPCRQSFCPGTEACVISTGACTPSVSGCTPADCGGAGNACVLVTGKPACVKTSQDSDIHPYPLALADYISMANGPKGLGIVVYDRIHGNLVGASKASGAWVATVLDGETGSRTGGTAVDTGDDGVGASLFIDNAGDWHVSYVNGITETLQYLKAPAGVLSPAIKPSAVDDGTAVNGQPFADGHHVVGDDSFIQVDGNASVTITYQDATNGTLRIATGTSGQNKWTLKTVPQPGRFGGFFPHIVPGDTTIANFWRSSDHASKDMFGDVAIVNPN